MPSPRPSGTPVSWEEVQSRAASRRAEAGRGSLSSGKSSSRNKSTPVRPSSAASAATRGAKSAARARPNVAFATVVNKRNNASADVRLLATGASISRVPFQDYKFGENVQNGDQVVVGFVDRDPKKPFIVGHGGHAIRRSTEEQATLGNAQWYGPYCNGGRTRINNSGGRHYSLVLESWPTPEHDSYVINNHWNPITARVEKAYGTGPQGLIAFFSSTYGNMIVTSYYRGETPGYVDVVLTCMDRMDENTGLARELVISVKGPWVDGLTGANVEPSRHMTFDKEANELVVYLGVYDNRLLRIDAKTCVLVSEEEIRDPEALMAGFDGDCFSTYENSTPETPYIYDGVFYSFRPPQLFSYNKHVFGEQYYLPIIQKSKGVGGEVTDVAPLKIPIWWTPSGGGTLRKIRTIEFSPNVPTMFKTHAGMVPPGWDGISPITYQDLKVQQRYILCVVGGFLYIGYSFHGIKSTISNYRTSYPSEIDKYAVTDTWYSVEVVGVAKYEISSGRQISDTDIYRNQIAGYRNVYMRTFYTESECVKTEEEAWSIAKKVYFPGETRTRLGEIYLQDFGVGPDGTQFVTYGVCNILGDSFTFIDQDKGSKSAATARYGITSENPFENTPSATFSRYMVTLDNRGNKVGERKLGLTEQVYVHWWGDGAVRRSLGSQGNPVFSPITTSDPYGPAEISMYNTIEEPTYRTIGDTLAIDPLRYHSFSLYGSLNKPLLMHVDENGSKRAEVDLTTIRVPTGSIFPGFTFTGGFSVVGGAIPDSSVYPVVVLLMVGRVEPEEEPIATNSNYSGTRYQSAPKLYPCIGGIRVDTLPFLTGVGLYENFPSEFYMPYSAGAKSDNGYYMTGPDSGFWVAIRTDTMQVTGISSLFSPHPHFPRDLEDYGNNVARHVITKNLMAFTANMIYAPQLNDTKWKISRFT